MTNRGVVTFYSHNGSHCDYVILQPPLRRPRHVNQVLSNLRPIDGKGSDILVRRNVARRELNECPRARSERFRGRELVHHTWCHPKVFSVAVVYAVVQNEKKQKRSGRDEYIDEGPHSVLDTHFRAFRRPQSFAPSSVMNVLELFSHWCLVFLPGLGILSLLLFGLLCFNVGLWPLLLIYLIYIFMCDPSYLEIDVWNMLRQRAGVLWPCPDYTSAFSVNGQVPDQPSLYTVHPHGLASASLNAHIMDPRSPLFQTFHHGHLAVHSFLFKVPIVREGLLFRGLIPATHHHMSHVLAQQRSVILIPGGVKEMSVSKRDNHQETWYLKKRRGFLKLAKQHKVPIVPIYMEGGQTFMTYDYSVAWLDKILGAITGISVNTFELAQVLLPHNLVQWQRALGPLDRPLTTAHMGAPFPVTGKVDEAHAHYVDHVKALFQSVHGDTKTLVIR